MVITRRHVLAGAAATVAAAALPAVAVAEAAKRGVVLTGSIAPAGPVPQIGNWYWEFATKDVFELTDRGWKFVFNLSDRARIPSEAEAEDIIAHIEAAEIRRSYTMDEIEDLEFS